MKIILGIKDVEQLIKEAYNGINEVIIENDDIEFILDVDGDDFYKIKSKEVGVMKDKKILGGNNDFRVPSLSERKVNLNEPPDFDSLVHSKPLVDSGVHPPKEKTVQEKNNEAISKGLMTSGRGSERPGRKF